MKKYTMGRERHIYLPAMLLVAILISGQLHCLAEDVSPNSPEQSDQASSNLEAEILLSAARNAAHRNDPATAIQRYERLLQRFSDQDEARLEYAGLLFQAGRTDDARREYERLLKQRSDDLALVRSLVDVLLTVGDHPRVRAVLEPVVEQNPDRTDFAIDLANVYALDGDFAAAQAIVTNRIEGRPLDTDKMRLDAVELFTQMRRPDLVDEPLTELRRNRPVDARMLAAEVRYAMLIGDLDLALQKGETLRLLYPQEFGLQLELASALYAAMHYVEAGQMFDQLLEVEPKNDVALLGAARVALRNNRIRDAAMFLDRVPDGSRGRQWRLVTIEFDVIAGKYRDARKTLNNLLEENPDDRRAAMSLADLDRAEHELIKADVRYEELGASSGDRQASLHLAESLLIQKRFDEAESHCRAALREDPDDPDALRMLGLVLAKRGQLTEAIAELAKAGSLGKQRLPEYIYYVSLVDGESMNSDWDPLSNAERPLYWASVIYELAMQDGRRELARRILDAGLERSPDNIVLQTNLAEWYASFGMHPYADEASRRYNDLLAIDPENEKWLLGLARTESTRRCYDRSLSLYSQLRRDNPRSYLIAREQARVVTAVCGTVKGLEYYDHAIANWSGLPEEKRRLCIERSAKSDHIPRPTAAAAEYRTLIAEEPYEQHLRFELGQVYGAVGSTQNAIATYSHLLHTYPNYRDARVALQGKWLDIQDRVYSDYRFRRERGRDGLTSIDRGAAYVGMRHVYDNEDEYLAGSYGRLNLAPTAGDAVKGNAFDLEYQRRLPSACSDWFAPCGTSYIFIDGAIESYDRLVSTRPVGLVGLKLRSSRDLIWTFAGSMDNVLENQESLRQDIYRGGLFAGVKSKPASFWDLELNYKYDEYSDDNNRHSIELRNRIQLTPDPSRFSLLVNMDNWNFEHSSVFQPGPDRFTGMQHPYFSPESFTQADVGVEWKQWLGCGPSPDYGRELPCRLQAPGLSNQRSRNRYGDRFDGADHWWISCSARKRWDSENKNYTIIDGMMVWDMTRRMSGYAKAEYLDGTAYQSTGAYAGLSWVY